MAEFVKSCVATPRGLSFTVEDLRLVQNWAALRRMRFTVRLDQSVDGAVFEEVIWLSAADPRATSMTIWRTSRHVVVQVTGQRPQTFLTTLQALESLGQAQPLPPSWRRQIKALLRIGAGG